jgi:IS605 OrfB family transposase
VKVTRIAFSENLNAGKYAQLEEQARRLGRVRSKVWREYGSDIAAGRESAKERARRAVHRRIRDEAGRRKAYADLKHDRWAGDPYLRRLMRQYWKHGRNRTRNQIVVRSDQYKTFTLREGGNAWLAVPGLERRQLVTIPLNTTVAPTRTLRLILRGGEVEVHYAIDAKNVRSSGRPCGTRTIGVDKGYTEVLTDSDGQHHGQQLGRLLSAESDHRKVKNARRAKLRSVAEKAEKRDDHAKAARIRTGNLGTLKRDRRSRAWKCQVRDITFQAVHAVTDKASVIVAEDLTRTFPGRKKLGKNTSRRLAAWTKGVTAEALRAVPDRRGSAVRLVNAAYTSQAVPFTSILGAREGDRLHCTACGAVWQADQDSSTSTTCQCGERNIQPMLNNEQQEGSRTECAQLSASRASTVPASSRPASRKSSGSGTTPCG